MTSNYSRVALFENTETWQKKRKEKREIGLLIDCLHEETNKKQNVISNHS